MKKIIIVLVILMMMSIPVSAEFIMEAGTEIDEELNIQDVEKDTYLYGEEIYVIAQNPEGPFDQDYLEITLIDTSGLGESILQRVNMEINPDWDTAGLPVTLEPGTYKIKISSYDDSGYVTLNIIKEEI